MSELAARLAELTPAQQERLRSLLARRAPSPASGASAIIPRVFRGDRAPLSFAQQRLWFLDQLEPGSSVYNLPLSLWLRGPLDPAAVATAIHRIVARHAVLRTTFSWAEDEPAQLVAPAAVMPLPVVDLSGLAPGRRERVGVDLLSAVAAAPFDLVSGPLLRPLLLRQTATDHLLLVGMHHIVSDGWSIDILMKELGTQYAAACNGVPDPLPPLPIQYADFAIWQRQRLQGKALDAQLEFWRRQLAGVTGVLPLPVDRRRPQVQRHRGAAITFRCDRAVARAVGRIAQTTGATAFMVCLAAFQQLLARVTGRADVCIGTPVAGRNQVETEELIGFFVNTLALRIATDDRQRVNDLLAQVRETCLEAFAHDELPFDMLVESLRLERSAAYNPIFQVVFSLQTAPSGDRAPDGPLQVEPIALAGKTAKFDLLLALELGDELTGSLEYDSDLFDPTTIRRLAGHYRLLLGAIAADRPTARLKSLPWLSRAQRSQALVEWPGRPTAYPSDQTLGALFEARVAATPQAIAFDDDVEPTSYRQLDRAANRLARHLRSRAAVGPEAFVGICTSSARAVVVACLAVVKCGATYVPLDPDHPPERLRLLLDDVGAAAVLTQQRFRDRLAAEDRVTICTDADADRIAEQLGTFPALPSRPDQLAYVLYTSGSTGLPKGVGVDHRAIVRLVRDTDYVQVTPNDRMAQISNPAFDAVTFEIWGALLNGACLVEIPRQRVLEPNGLARELVRRNVGVMFVTVALFNRVIAEQPRAFASMRCVIFGGEAADAARVRECARSGAPRRLLNGYGPTESTTFATTCRVRDVEDDDASVPIGRAIANTEVYVLDRHMEPVPVLVLGELYIGGAGLARGYLGRPALTAAAFVPDPRAMAPGARLYRTGDHVRLLRDGRVDFIGRRDDQVKIRGFRIELGEIEAAFEEHPAVRDAVVLARDDLTLVDGSPDERTEDRRLVGYVVLDAGSAAGPDDLRQHLRALLPAFMVPGPIVVLDALPLTPNGKVDRRALPRPDAASAEDEHVEPRNPLEQVLAGMWQRLLGFEQVSVRANFFELGGHSLLATQLLARLRQSFQVDFALIDLFGNPTVEELAATIQSRLHAAGDGGTPVAFPLLFDRYRLWFMDDLEPGTTAFAVGASAHRPGELNVPAMIEVLKEAANRRRQRLDSESLPAAEQTCLVPLQLTGREPPFFCVHPGTGHVAGYALLARYLGRDRPFYAIQSVVEDGRPKYATIEEMAERYLEEVRALQPDGPYQLGGWSMGGFVALEMAQRLLAAGEAVPRLVLIDTQMPSAEDRQNVDHDDRLYKPFARHLGLEKSQMMPATEAMAHQRRTRPLAYLLEHAHQRGALPHEVELPELERLFALFRANFKAMVGYRPRPYAGATALIAGDESSAGSPQHLALLKRWFEHLDVHRVSGDHFSMLKKPHVPYLVESIKACLDPTGGSER